MCVAFIGPKSRTERLRKTKIGTEVAHVTRDSNTTFKVKRSKVKVTRPLWLAVLAGQHGDRVSDRSICVYDVYRVTTCRPGRGHIVAAARLQLVIVITLNKHRGKDRLQSCDRSLDGTGAETHTCREKPEWSTLHVRKSSFEINWRQYSRAILHSATMLLHFRRGARTGGGVNLHQRPGPPVQLPRCLSDENKSSQQRVPEKRLRLVGPSTTAAAR